MTREQMQKLSDLSEKAVVAVQELQLAVDDLAMEEFEQQERLLRETERAFVEGVNARECSKNPADNPYSVGTKDYHSWRIGWQMRARAESEEEKYDS
jgi:hypothetical protein